MVMYQMKIWKDGGTERWMEIRNSLYKFSDKGYGKKFMNNVKESKS